MTEENTTKIESGEFSYICKKHGDVSQYYLKASINNKELDGYYCLLCIFEFLYSNFGKLDLQIKPIEKKEENTNG